MTALDVMTQAIAAYHHVHPWDHRGLAAAQAEARAVIGALYGIGYQILEAEVVSSDV